MKKIEIIRKDLSPIQLKIAAILIVFAINYKVLSFTFFDVNPLVYIFSIFSVVAIWTAKDILVIDFENGLICEGFKIFGLRFVDKTAFDGLEKVYINSVSTGETFRHLATTKTIHHTNYKAFLKTDEGLKVWLGTDTDKERLIKRLNDYNRILCVDIYDNTLPVPTIVVSNTAGNTN